MAFDWIDQYVRLKSAHARYSSPPETFDERWAYVDIAKTQIKGRQTGEKFIRQLEHVFESGLYERDIMKLKDMQARVDYLYRQFSQPRKSKSTYSMLEAQALAIATGSSSLLIAADNALEARLKRLPANQGEAVAKTYPESFYPEKSEKSNIPF